MTSTAMKPDSLQPAADMTGDLFDNWFEQINMRKVDGWQTLSTKPIDQPIDLAA